MNTCKFNVFKEVCLKAKTCAKKKQDLGPMLQNDKLKCFLNIITYTFKKSIIDVSTFKLLLVLNPRQNASAPDKVIITIKIAK